MNEEIDTGFDWGWLWAIIMTWIIPPIGVFMLYKQYKKTMRAGNARSYKKTIPVGMLMAIIGALIFLDEPSFVPALLTAGGFCLAAFSGVATKRNASFRSYISIIDGRPLVDLQELQEATGHTRARVIHNLERMIKQGLLPERAYVDHGMQCLVLEPEEMRKQRAQRKKAPVIPDPVVAEPVKQPTPAPEKRQSDILHETFDAKLREIRYLNDLIDDKAVSDRIDDIERTTANIFYLVEEKPERMDEIRTFMNYYLPTTFKLLNAYARLEKQNTAGSNIRKSRREIEQILDKLAEGFRQQLDRLFQTEAIDISSDIDVLETMMARDGLTEDGLKMGGH